MLQGYLGVPMFPPNPGIAILLEETEVPGYQRLPWNLSEMGEGSGEVHEKATWHCYPTEERFEETT